MWRWLNISKKCVRKLETLEFLKSFPGFLFASQTATKHPNKSTLSRKFMTNTVQLCLNQILTVYYTLVLFKCYKHTTLVTLLLPFCRFSISCILKSTITNGLTQSHTVLPNIPRLQECSRFCCCGAYKKVREKPGLFLGLGLGGNF